MALGPAPIAALTHPAERGGAAIDNGPPGARLGCR